MRAAARHYERTEREEHPMKRYVTASFPNQINQRSGNCEVGQANEEVSNRMSPHQSRLAKVAILMRQEILSQNAIRESRPNQKWDGRNRQQDDNSVKNSAGGKWRWFDQSEGGCGRRHATSSQQAHERVRGLSGTVVSTFRSFVANHLASGASSRTVQCVRNLHTHSLRLPLSTWDLQGHFVEQSLT